MTLFYISGIFLVLSLVLTIASIFLHRNATYFEKNKQLGKGIVSGYGNQYGDQLRVELVKAEDDFFLNKNYDCQVGGILPQGQYPIGKEIDVYYVPKKLFGSRYAVVYLMDFPPISGFKLGKIFTVVAFVLFIMTLILAIFGIITMV